MGGGTGRIVSATPQGDRIAHPSSFRLVIVRVSRKNRGGGVRPDL